MGDFRWRQCFSILWSICIRPMYLFLLFSKSKEDVTRSTTKGGFRRNLSCVRWVNACRPHHKRSVVTHLVQGRVKHTNLNWHVPICWICLSVYFPTSLLLGNFLFGFFTLFIANSSIVFFSNYGDILFWFDFPNIEDISLISGTFCLLFPPTLYNLKNINFLMFLIYRDSFEWENISFSPFMQSLKVRKPCVSCVDTRSIVILK